jgi:hypothetical protein
MSWRDEVYRISIVKHLDGIFPFEVSLYDKNGEKMYSLPLQKTGNEAWALAKKYKTQIAGSLDMFMVDEALEEAVMEHAQALNSH